MDIKKVAVLGAGAVGSYVIWSLWGTDGIKLSVIADGERAERIRRDGCLINDEVFYPEVMTAKEAEDVDLLIVAVKYGALRQALPDIKSAVGENTVVMSLLNGVDSEEIIAGEIGSKHVLPSLIKVASQKKGNGYRFNPENTIGIIFGEYSEPFKSERVLAVTALFEKSHIHYKYTECIKEEMWSKFRLNICNNLPQAILGAGIGCYSDSTHMAFISEKMKQEVEMVAAAKGIDIAGMDKALGNGTFANASSRYSTLQDLDAGRHTETDMFSGVIVKMGRELGIPTPYNEFVHHMIKAIEEKNDGYFDYDGDNDRIVWSK